MSAQGYREQNDELGLEENAVREKEAADEHETERLTEQFFTLDLFSQQSLFKQLMRQCPQRERHLVSITLRDEESASPAHREEFRRLLQGLLPL